MITTSTEGTVRTLSLSRPGAANALDATTYAQLAIALESASDDPSVSAVVLASQGDRAFCAGADIKEFSELSSAEGALRRRALLLSALDRLLAFPKPVVAAVQGAAIGAGAMLALVCDEIVVASSAWIAFPEIAAGMPSPMGLAILRHRTDLRTMQRLIQHGERFDGRAASDAGLADDVVELDRVLQSAIARATRRDPAWLASYRINKEWINRPLRTALAEAAETATRAANSIA
jgi:enoyl-CoA hydratase/carnithine racemase